MAVNKRRWLLIEESVMRLLIIVCVGKVARTREEIRFYIHQSINTARANYPQSHHHHGMMKWSVILFHIADGGLLIDEWMTESWIDVLSADEVRSKLIMKSTISLTARRKRCPTYVSYLFYLYHALLSSFNFFYGVFPAIPAPPHHR